MYLLEVRHSPPFLLLCTLDNTYVTGFAKIIPKGTRSEINNIIKCDSYTNYLAIARSTFTHGCLPRLSNHKDALQALFIPEEQ